MLQTPASSLAYREPLRLLIVISNAGRGGAEKRAGEVLAHFDRSRITPRLVVFEGGGPLIDAAWRSGVEVDTVPRKGWFPLRYADRLRTVRRVVREYRPHVVHAWDHISGIYLRLPGFMPAKVPVIASLNSSQILNRRLFLIERLLSRWTRCYVVNSQAAADYLQRSMPAAPRGIQVIRQGLDVGAMRSRCNDTVSRSLRGEWGIPEDHRLIGMVGKLSTEKNPILLVEIAGRLVHRHEDLHFVLVGSGPLEPMVKQRIQDLGLREVFHLIPEHPEGPIIPASFDVSVLTSDVEGLPNVLLEYMYWRQPIVVTNVGDSASVVRDGREARVVPPGDVKAFSAALEELLTSPDLADRLGEAARHRLEEEFTITRYVQDLEALYHRLVR